MSRHVQHYEVESPTGTPLAIGEAWQRPVARPVERRDASRYLTRAAAERALDRAGLGCEAVEIVRVEV